MPTDPISRVPNAPITDLALAIDAILGHDCDPAFPSSLILLHAMRDAIANPAALGIAGLTTAAWVLPANEDIASQNDPTACRVCPDGHAAEARLDPGLRRYLQAPVEGARRERGLPVCAQPRRRQQRLQSVAIALRRFGGRCQGHQ
jgi:hypothetical protein